MPSNTTGDFTVFKRNSPISANVTNAAVGEVEKITVNLPTNATGTVLLTVNGSNYYATLDKGVAVFDVTGLPIGNHTAYITYEGDDKYLSNNTEVNITTEKRNLTISITTANVTVIGHQVIFEITTSVNITEVVIVKIINRATQAEILSNHTFIENGKGTFTAYNLDGGNYTATVIFPGNVHYGAANNQTNFSVSSKNATSLTVKVNNITLGEDAVIYVNVTGAKTGRVTLNMAGMPQTKDVVDGKVNFTVDANLLTARNYHVTVTYIENDDYLSSNDTADFTVYRKNSTVTITAINITVGQKEVFNVTISHNTTGYVLISFADVNLYANLNGSKFISIPVADLPVGEYNVTVTYTGDDNYFGSTNKTFFKITNRQTSINITCDEVIVEGKPVEFTIMTSANFTEVVTVVLKYRNGAVYGNYTTFVQNGTGFLSVYGLDKENYTAFVYFRGNLQYDAVDNSTNFTVSGKNATSLTVKVENITIGDDAVIYVNVTGAKTGNVTLAMSGNPQTKEVVNGMVNFTIPAAQLTARNYHLTVVYLENEYYLRSTETADFTVKKKNTPISVNVTNISVGDLEIINVTVDKNATGIVLIDIAGVQVYAKIINGTASATFDDLGIDKYNVTVTYNGDDNYNGNSTNASFNVTKHNLTVIIKAQNITVGQAEVFTITTSANITSVITIKVNNTNYTSFVQNGKGNLTVFGLGKGTYTATVYINDNHIYNDAVNSTNFTVSAQKASNINISIANITIGENATVYVNVTKGVTGNVTIVIIGREYTGKVDSEGKVNFTIPAAELSARNYHVTAYYLGDTYYLGSNNSTDFVVNKKSSAINVTATNVTVGNATTIDIKITNGTSGVVLININGTDYYANITNGVANLVVNNFAVGEYDVKVTYNGDTIYGASSSSTKFKVSKLNSKINITLVSVTPVPLGNYVVIDVTGPADVTGVSTFNVTHTGVNGVLSTSEYTVYINNGKGQLIISESDLHIGKYTAKAVYAENYKYLSNVSNSVEFEVYSNGTELDVDSHNIYVGQNETITVIIHGNYTGNVNISIEGIATHEAPLVYNETSNQSVATWTFTGTLSAGLHKVEASFIANEDGKIVTHKGSSTFIVSKINSTITIKPIINIKVGENANITLTIDPSEATGTIDVYVNGEKHTLTMDNLTLILPDLGAAHYFVQAMYSGDDKYLASSANATFDVYKNNINVGLEVSDIRIDQTEYINVTLENDAKGYVLININGTHYYAEVKDGVASIHVTGLTKGTYTVNATFTGDDKYYSNSTVKTFNVSKLTTTIEINGSTIYVGQNEVFTITMSANITEVVTIEIVGKGNYTAYVVNGTGTYTVSGLTNGTYNAFVYFPGNTQYANASGSTTFEVKSKQKSAITVKVADIVVRDEITVYVNATDGINGTVFVTIAGVAYTQTLVNGRVNFNVPGLTARNYQVSALFIGNDEYEACNSSSTFVVHKKNTTITVDVTNSTVGSIEYINVTVQAMNGTVLLTVNGSHYYSDVINGVASFNVTGLGEAIHTASITYMGNEEYNSNDTTAEINITKLTTTISIVTVNITEGQVAVFNITTSANFTEVVTVTIGDNNYTTFVENGKGTLSVYDLAADTYTAVVSFPGNTQYKPASGSTEFTVSAKKDSQISITVHNITVVDTETIEVTVTPNDAGGKITIVIAGSEYTENITEGKAVFNINNLTARDYHVTAIYHGDTYYNVNSAEANFTVSKVPSVINLTVSDINEGEVEIINVTATPGATGVVLITIGDTHYYAELNEGKATFNVPGLAYGKYDAQVTYLGNDKYNSSTNVKSFTVKPKIVVEATTNNGNTTELVIKVDTNASGDVNVTVNGQTYPAKVVNGTAKVNVSDVTPGETNVTVKYSEDGLGEVEQNMTVDIPKVTGYDMTVSPTVIKEGGNSTVVVSVPEDAKGNVTITAGNKTYTAPIENGTAKFDLSDLPVGSHDVSVSYDGDNRYAGKNTTAHINKVINLPTVNAVDHLVRGWNSQFDYEAVFTNEFGEVLVATDVTFIINGKSYTVKTEAHGVAKLSETLPVGEYNVTSVNPVTGEVITKKLSIVPRLIQNKDITMEFMDSTYYTVRVIGDDGNPVGEGEIIDIYVNTIHYVSKTDKNGYARLKINLNPQKYKVMAEYKNYKVYNKLVVKQTLKLVKKTVSVKKSAKKLVLKAKLKWANGKAIKGKKIVFKFKGKKYTAKTNKKGIAQVTIKKNVIKKLKKGKTYKYSASYLKNTVKGKVKVKK